MEAQIPKLIAREKELAKIVADVEAEASQTALKLPGRRQFNQPNLLAISSLNALPEPEDQSAYSMTGFYKFNVNLPLPLLDVESLQLLNANIPQASANLSNTACVFWYYRLSAYSGLVPNLNNLFYVRLLPSYYKKEYIQYASRYGYNRTFKKYSDLATELVNSCAYDLLDDNVRSFNQGPTEANVKVPFMRNAVSVTYDSTINKFQFTGIPTAPVYTYYASGTTYAINDIIAYGSKAYKSLQNGNVGHTPSTSTTWWSRLYSTEVIAKWDDTTPYGTGRYVSYNNALYVSTYANNGFPPDASILAWVSGHAYFPGSVVTYSGVKYTAVLYSADVIPPGTSTAFVATNWSNSTSYAVGFVTYSGGNYYVCLLSNSGNNPTTQPSVYWQLVGASFWSAATLPDTTNAYPAYNYLSTGYNDPNVALAQGTALQQWNPYNLYEVEGLNTVSYNGRNWLNARQTTNEEPFNVTSATITSGIGQNGVATFQSVNYFSVGQLIVITGLSPSSFNGTFRVITANGGSFSVRNTAFGGPSTPNITINSTGTGSADYPAYSGSVTYQTGDVVLWETFYYTATGTTIGQNPSPLYRNWRSQAWAVSPYTPPTIGLNTNSSQYDFTEFITVGALQYELQPFPYGIPGQPFTPNPKRLLNTALGFTFNGLFTPSVYSMINQGPYTTIVIQKSSAQFYNLLRPVPRYVALTQLSAVDPLLSSTPSTALTYTAEGYCNLVFSSEIYIYSSIVLGSSVDTQKVTNLLSVIPLNCGNLGVAFGANYIDNAMTKVGGDLYTVSIEFYNEYAEPYYLTNNAVATLIFKMSYKSAEKVVRNIV